MCAASDFRPASELPASLSREEQLEALVKTQAIAIERMEQMLDSQPQQAGGKMSGQEKAAILEILSKLDKRIKDLEAITKAYPVDELDLIKDRLIALQKKTDASEELFSSQAAQDRQRIAHLEKHSQPKETATNQAHLQAIWEELLRRQRAGTRGISYREAAAVCNVDKSTIKKLHGLIAADLRFDIIWHPKRKNTKLICLKNYK